MDRHGHLFIRSLLPVASVVEARVEAIELCREVGWIDPAAAASEGRWNAEASVPLDGGPEWMTFYRRWVQAPRFQSLPEDPALMRLTERLLGDAVLVHPRKIGRVGFPQNEGQQTPVHQDFFHVRGTTETYTVWVPLGDCSQTLGCLAVADGSHQLGFRDHQPSSGPGGFAVDPGGAPVWRSNDFVAGDVLIFHSLTMHKALPNRTPDEIRVSIDNRYQRAQDDVDPGSLKPHA
jgi:hypothetical protein